MSDRFDDLARRMAAPMPRRRTFAVLAGALATVVLPSAVRRGRAADNLQRSEDFGPQYLLDFETIIGDAEKSIWLMHARARNVPVSFEPGASYPVKVPIELLESRLLAVDDNTTYAYDERVTAPFVVLAGRLITSQRDGEQVIDDIELVITPGDTAGTCTATHHNTGGGSDYYEVFTLPVPSLTGMFAVTHYDEIDHSTPVWGSNGFRISNWAITMGSEFTSSSYADTYGESGERAQALAQSRPLGAPVLQAAEKTFSRGALGGKTTFKLRRAGKCPSNQPSCGSACCPEGGFCCDPGRGLCCEPSVECCNSGPDGQCCGPGTTCVRSGEPALGGPLADYICCPSDRACKAECCAPGYVCVAELICCSPASVCGEDSRACCPSSWECCGGTSCCATDAGFACCNGACIDIMHDPNNCGACGHACPPQGNNPNPFFCGQGVCLERRGHGIGGMITRN